MATLTGACVVALGSHASGLFANDDALAVDLLAAGEFVWDRAWQMPVWDDYQQALKSNFADMANVGGRDGGAVVAACFLSRFAKKFAWAHLDVAGSAYASGTGQRFHWAPGSAAVPVRSESGIAQRKRSDPYRFLHSSRRRSRGAATFRVPTGA